LTRTVLTLHLPPMARSTYALIPLGFLLLAAIAGSARADEPSPATATAPIATGATAGPSQRGPLIPPGAAAGPSQPGALVSTGATAQSPPACVPGAQAQCACPGGGLGVQVCDDSGVRFGPCDCSGARAPLTEPRPMARRNQSGFNTGLGLTIAGGVAFLAGTTWLVALFTSTNDASCTNQDDSTAKCVVAGGIGVLGAAGLAVGIPMMITNGEMVPAPDTATAAPWWLPKSVGISRSGARVLWTF
jgi:hypothetical protein